MASQAGKLAPLVLTVIGAGYCVWPYAQNQPPPAAPTSDMPKIETSWLNPQFPPASPRNLFQPVVPASVAVAAKRADEAKLEQARKAADESKKKAERNSLLEGWTLGATMMHGARRGAVVNGKVYLQGETIAPPSSGGQPLSLFRVERDRVILLRPKRTEEIVLVYSPPAAREAAKTAGARPPGGGAPKRLSVLDRLMSAMDGKTLPTPAALAAELMPSNDPAPVDAAAKPGAPAAADSDEERQP